jgi:hypothetical protein
MSLDLGTQIAYLALAVGVPVYSSEEQEVGHVDEILSAGNEDIFDGLMVRAGLHKHYVMADSIDAIYEGGVVLNVREDDFKQLGSDISS